MIKLLYLGEAGSAVSSILFSDSPLPKVPVGVTDCLSVDSVASQERRNEGDEPGSDETGGAWPICRFSYVELAELISET